MMFGRRVMVLMFLLPILLGLTMQSMSNWEKALNGAPPAPAAGETGPATAPAPGENAVTPTFKADAVEAAGIMQLHNDIYSAVGEKEWEGRIKPELAAWTFGRIVADTGVAIPSDDQILDWLRSHREEVQSKLRSMAP